MRRRTHTAATLVAVLLLVTVAAAPAAAAYPSAGTVCDGVDELRVVVAFPDGSAVGEQQEQSRTLYPGTSLRVMLCNGGDPLLTGSEWSLPASVSGLSVDVENAREYAYPAKTTDFGGQVSIADAIDEKANVAQPTLTVTTGAAATVEETTVHFSTRGSYQDFTQANQRYTDVSSEIRAGTAELNNTSVKSGVDDQRLTNLTQAVTAIDQTGELVSTENDVENALFAAAQAGDSNAVTALSQRNERTGEIRDEARNALKQKRSSLEKTTAGAATSVLMNLLGFAVVGVVVGSGAGWAVTKRKLAEVEYWRSRSSAVDFDPRQVALPVAVAGVLVLLALVLLVVLGLLGPLGSVLEAMI